LVDRGIPFHQQGHFPFPRPEEAEISIYVNMQIDHVVKRCIAKYAFNYMARVTGPDFALLSSFNATRSYIREGISPGYRSSSPTIRRSWRPTAAPCGKRTATCSP